MQGFIRIDKVASTKAAPGRYPVSRATIHRWVKQGLFPAPIKLGPKASVWRVADLDAFDKASAQPKFSADADTLRLARVAVDESEGAAITSDWMIAALLVCRRVLRA